MCFSTVGGGGGGGYGSSGRPSEDGYSRGQRDMRGGGHDHRERGGYDRRLVCKATWSTCIVLFNTPSLLLSYQLEPVNKCSVKLVCYEITINSVRVRLYHCCVCIVKKWLLLNMMTTPVCVSCSL